MPVWVKIIWNLNKLYFCIDLFNILRPETAHIAGIKYLECLIGKKQIVDKKLTRKEELYNI